MYFIGLAISLWPMIVPYNYSLWQAVSSPSTRAFPLIGTLFLLPVILMYRLVLLGVRGKVRDDTAIMTGARVSAFAPRIFSASPSIAVTTGLA